jgi:hypothetical protein
VGNLNQFYLMGRVVGSPRIVEAERGPIAEIALAPGSSGRGPRGGSPLRFQAAGPQFEPGKALKDGDAVLLRGQLRNEPVEGSDEGRLIAWVQAIEHLAGSSGGGGGGESGSRPRRKRRRRGGRKEGGSGHSDKQGGEDQAGESGQRDKQQSERPKSDKAKAADATQQLPPPKPIAEAPQAAPAPDPSYSKDMPF